MNYQKSANSFVKELIHIYFLNQNIHPILTVLDEQLCWSGIGIDESMQGYQAFIQMLHDEKILLSSYHLSKESYQSLFLSDDLTQVFCTLNLKKETLSEYELLNIELRISIILKQIEHTYRITSVHFSVGNLSNDKDKSVFHSLQDVAEIHLQRIIESKTHELENRNKDLQRLTENLPGGIFRCLYDEDLTLVQMSSGFLSMFGYTREEIEHHFQNSFRKLIDPKDLERVNEEVRQQMLISDSKTLEYRVICKDGHSLWVLDKGQRIVDEDGTVSFYCILIDTTDAKEAREQLQMSLERHKIITNQTNDIIFEWDIIHDVFEFSANWEKKFGYLPLASIMSKEIPEKSHIYDGDSTVFLNMLMDAKAGKPYAENEIRIWKHDGTYIWCNVRITTQFDNNHIPVSIVGVFIDIDDMKKASAKLLEKAEHDSLTKLFNKETAQSMIEESLYGSYEHALMIVDIDNFKLINDSMGHLFGDAFLQEVSKQLLHSVRQEDIVGRIGGDEFIILIKDISKLNKFSNKVEQIIQAFRNIPIKEIEKRHISCSIGVSLFPKHGKDFKELYRNADYALYEAKKQGKNRYVIFDEEKHNDSNIFLTYGEHSEVNAPIDSDKDNPYDLSLNTIIEYVFKILYRSIDMEAAIASILEVVGKKFDVSRVYIFENSEDDAYCTNTFEWCNEGICAEKDSLQHVSYKDDMEDRYEDNFNEMDIFYCRDIKELPPEQYAILSRQNIKSMLQCAIHENGKFKGFVGFDECRNNRFWTQNQINSLAFIAELVSTFLLKERIRKRLEENANGLQTILDNQDSWIYVVDAVEYKMLYINRKTLELVPQAKTGKACHKAFFNRDTPCDLCPIKEYHIQNQPIPLEIYNELLDKWTLSNACRIQWEGKDAFMLSCLDITKYKK